MGRLNMGNSKSKYTQLIKESVIGYKSFSSDLTCRGFQYEVGQTYTISVKDKIKLGRKGFHFCRIPDDCHKYYPREKTTRYAKVEAWDSIHTVNNSVARTIKILEEITYDNFTHMTGSFTTTDRTIHLKNGFLHRDNDLPSVEFANGDKEYHQEGQLDRQNDKPAIEKINGDVYYYQKWQLHRDGGPAIKLHDGSEKWYQNNKLHRDDGPAIKLSDGTEHWYQNHQLHRVGGPASTTADGTQYYYDQGIRHCLDGHAIRYPNGDYKDYVEGQLHNKTQPAMKSSDFFGVTYRWFIRDQEFEHDKTNHEYADPSFVWIEGKCYKPKYCDYCEY